jgi:uncharacterized protein YuzE
VNVSYDRAADAAYFGFSDEPSVRQEPLDDSRILDFAADGTLVGVEILSPSLGVDLSDVPRATEIAAAIHQLGFEVRSTLR